MGFQCKHQPCHNTKHKGHGYCDTHYRQKYVMGRETTDIKIPKHKPGDECSFNGCNRLASSKSLCNTHWTQKYKYGIELREINNFVLTTCAAPWCGVEYRTTVNHKFCKQCRERQKRYNVSEDWYITMPQSCEICGSNKRISIDHDHRTEAVRGVLCGTCNTTLGYAGDTLESVMRFVKYLEKNNVKPG